MRESLFADQISIEQGFQILEYHLKKIHQQPSQIIKYKAS